MVSFQLDFEAIGTRWVIDVIDAPDTLSKRHILNIVKLRIDSFDRIYSRFRKDSLIIEMSVSPGTFTLPLDAKPLIDLYKKLYHLTDGAFTPLIGQLLSDAGYDASYSLKPGTLTHPYTWEEAISYKYPTLTLKKPTILDFGAAGKGYLIDLVSGLLTELGIESFCIDAGGDMFYQNIHGNTLRVGLEHPENVKQVIGIATIANQAICGSAGNRRKWSTFHHIINPHTLTSPDTVLAVWVVAGTTILADALSTCLFFTSPKKLVKHYNFEYLILYPDYSIEKSNAFPAELFYNKQ